MTDILPDLGNSIISQPVFDTKDPPAPLQGQDTAPITRQVPVPTTVDQMMLEGDDPSQRPVQPIDLENPTQLRQTPDAVSTPAAKTPDKTWSEWAGQWGEFARQSDLSVTRGFNSLLTTMGLGAYAISKASQMDQAVSQVNKSLPNVLSFAIEEKDPAKRAQSQKNLNDAVPMLFTGPLDQEYARYVIDRAFTDPSSVKNLQGSMQTNPFDDNAFRALIQTQKWIDTTFAPSKDFANTWPDKISGGAGSMLAFMAAEYFGGPYAGYSAGALSGVGQQFQDALSKGAPPDVALKAALLGMIPGLTENVPIEMLLAHPSMSNFLLSIAVSAGRQAIAEGGQEALQQVMQNAIALYLYKPDQQLMEGVKDSAIVGGVLGGGFSAGVDLIGLRGHYYDEKQIKALNDEWERQKAAGAKTFDPGPIPPAAKGTPADPNANPLPPSVRSTLEPAPAPPAPKDGETAKPPVGSNAPQEPAAQGQPRLSDVAPGTPLHADPTPKAPDLGATINPAEPNGQSLIDMRDRYLAERKVTSEDLAKMDPASRETLQTDFNDWFATQTEASAMRSVPAFQAWFGQSKVVDDKGEPLVVYHGTPVEGITEFNTKTDVHVGPGMFDEATTPFAYFTSDKGAARTYGRNVMPVFLRMQNPLVVDAEGKSFNEFLPSAYIGQALRDGHDGVIVNNIIDRAHGTGKPATTYIALDPTSIKSIFNEGTYDPRDPDISHLPSTSLRTGAENLSEFGIDPGDKVKVREVAAALEARQRAKAGLIPFDDFSPEAMNKLSDWLATEVEFELQPANIDKSAFGWYTDKFQRALDTFGKKYPELIAEDPSQVNVRGRIYDKQDARDLLTALFAITSDGQQVLQNFRSADNVYAFYRENGVLPANVEGARGERMASMKANIARLQELIDEKGIRATTQYLLTERRVSEINAELRKLGKEVDGKLPASAMMPMSAVEFGPKLGAFYANLMGTQGYLTMDMWWTRTFNRLRGTLLTKPSEAGLKRVAGMVMAQKGLKKAPSRAQLLKIITEQANSYKAKGYKDGTELEKASNTIFKDAYMALEESPQGASDRAFMIATAKQTQQKLAARGHPDLTIADIQALIWYYEKRLYGELGAKQSNDISYEEAAQQSITGEDLRQSGSADATARAADAGGAQAAGAVARQPGRTDRPQATARAVSANADAYPPLKGLPPQSPGPVPRIVDAAKIYAQLSGIPYRRQAEHVTADPERGARIARAYDAMKNDPEAPEVKRAYRAMIDETLAQYQAVKAMGLKVEVIEDGAPNPYPEGPRQVLIDLQNNHLWLFPTESGFGTINEIRDNPLLEPTNEKIGDRVLLANDVFRIVHDVFGHGKEGVGFGPSGEENAWQSHVRMYSDLAARAMTSETRGQNSWVNFGPYGASNRANQRETVYADQKTGLMPEWTVKEGIADDTDTEHVSQILAPIDRTSQQQKVMAPRGGYAHERVRPAGGIASQGQAQSMTKEEIGQTFQKAINLTVEQGRFGRGNHDAAAIYKWAQSVARVSDRGDLTALFHEGAHHIHAMMGPSLDAVIQRHLSEIHDIANRLYGGGGKINPANTKEMNEEGFATFFQIWMNNPAAAAQVAPGFKQSFEALINAKSPELSGAFKLIQEGVEKLVTEKPSIDLLRERMRPLRKETTVAKVRESIKQGNFLHDIGTLANRIYQKTFDDAHPLTLAVAHLKQIAEHNVRRAMDLGILDRPGAERVLNMLDKRGRSNPIKMMWMARNAYGISTEMLASGIPLYNGNGDPVTLGLPAILAIAQGTTKGRLDPKLYDDFNAYLSARRIVQEWDNYDETRKWQAATERGKKYPEPRTKRFRVPDDLSKGDAIKALTELHQKYPNFDRAAQELYKFQNAMLQYRYDAGDLTQDQYDYMSGMQNYVPLRRDMGTEGLSAIGKRKDVRTGKDDLIRVFRGSSRPIINPVDAIMQAVHEQIALTMHNQVKRSLVDMALDVGQNSGAIVEKIPATAMKGTQVNIAEVLRQAGDFQLAEEIAGALGHDDLSLQEFLDEFLDGDETATIWRSTDINEKGEKIIYVRRSGKVEAYKLNDPEWAGELYNTLTELGREQASVLINVLGKSAAVLRAGVVTAPPYMIANTVRDQLQAWILNDGVYPLVALGKGLKNDLFDRKTRRLYNMSGAAIAGSNIAALDRTRIGTEQSRLAKLGIGVTFENSLDNVLRVVQGSETWTRQAIWLAAYKKAKADGLSDGDAMAEAGFESSDYTNYGRAGSRMLGARRLITFLNANLQGLDKSIRVALGGEGGAAYLRKVMRPWAARTFGLSGPRTSLPLTAGEQQALSRGLRTVAKMVSLSLVSALLGALYWDDEEYDTMSPYLKGTRWMVKLAPGQWLAVPKPFQLAIFATATEYAMDAYLKNDPTALQKFMESQGAVLVPPYENPVIRLAYETATNTNLFNGQPIISPELKGMEPWLQYNQYTSELGKGIGRMINVSPQLVDHYITSSFATWGRGALSLSNYTNPNRPAQGLDDLAFTSFFIKNGARSSTVRPAFWDLMALEGGRYTGFAQGYQKLMDAGATGQAQEFLSRIPEEGRVFAELYYDAKDKWKADGKKLHPLRNAYDVATIISGMRKEITLNQFKADKGEGDPIVLSPTKQKLLNDRLSELSVREMRNALVLMGEPGWGQRKILPTLPIYDQIKEIDPQTAIELKKRMNGKVYAFDVIRQTWPSVRHELLINGADANLRPQINRAKTFGTKFFTNGEPQ